jgi:hypothetical protein
LGPGDTRTGKCQVWKKDHRSPRCQVTLSSPGLNQSDVGCSASPRRLYRALWPGLAGPLLHRGGFSPYYTLPWTTYNWVCSLDAMDTVSPPDAGLWPKGLSSTPELHRRSSSTTGQGRRLPIGRGAVVTISTSENPPESRMPLIGPHLIASVGSVGEDKHGHVSPPIAQCVYRSDRGRPNQVTDRMIDGSLLLAGAREWSDSPRAFGRAAAGNAARGESRF